jgi:hypothetical protein
MFVPGSCGDFFVKSLHLNDAVILENSALNTSTALTKVEKYSYSSLTDYSDWKYIDFEVANCADNFVHADYDENQATVWYMNNHGFTNLQKDNILGEFDTELRLLMDLTGMEKFVICNGYKKNNKFESYYVDRYKQQLAESTDLQYVSLKKIVESEASFITEYKRILALIGILITNEQLVLKLYNEWKTTVPDVSTISIEEFMFNN